LAAILGLASAGEVALITMQRWRGVPSHFNNTTLFDSVVFGAMGALVVCIAVAIIVIAATSFAPVRASPSLGWAIRLGLLLLVAGQGIGVSIVANGSNTFGLAGSMTLPHAVTLHAIQVLPAVAWLAAFTDWREAIRLCLVAVTGVAYAVLAATLALQTYRGLAPFDLGPLEMGLMAAGTLTLLGVAVITASGLRQRNSKGTPASKFDERKT
jgi:hypothetical protein